MANWWNNVTNAVGDFVGGFFGKDYNPDAPKGVRWTDVNTNADKIASALTNTNSDNSASTVVEDSSSVPSLDRLYRSNQEWAEEQAQKQMDFQTSANKIAMDFSSAEADKARAWEAEMANSAYQRVVADLKAAGLNPILAYSQGGAAVPSVSSAQGVTSAGAKASTSDTGYGYYENEFGYNKMLVNGSVSLVKAILSFLK